ncbi:MAG TPA: protein translocase subunit SecD, partial [Azonexus sp.]|nr:protein translocase subunit SecD [Azonexus sp.]
MNRYPLWKYITVAVALVLGFTYTLPNFFGESPAVQVSSAKATLKVDQKTLARVEESLKGAAITHEGIQLDFNGVKTRLRDTDTQLKAKDVLEKAFNPDPADPQYVVALNLLSASPSWLTALHALPMYLGLDLRGGVHFLLQVDMKGALTKRLDSISADLRTVMRDKNLRHAGVNREGDRLIVKFRDAETRDKARNAIADSQPDLTLAEQGEGSDLRLVATLKPEAQMKIGEFALKQNITTLHNRINELGVAEPVIQQQGADRIVVQLPGVQDTALAKEILGATATLEFRMVEEGHNAADAEASKRIPAGSELYHERGGAPVLLQRRVILTGDYITDASSGLEQDSGKAAVFINLDSKGGRIMANATKDAIGKLMAVVFIENKVTTREVDGKPVKQKSQIKEVINIARINDQLGSRFQITGLDSPTEARNLALLLRAGALAAPIEIIEERTVGPSLGAENIQRGFHSTWIGFALVAVFMIIYYMAFGVTSVIALGVNVILLVALLSMLQATLTLPGMAAIALTVGMAIDANVLINERIREELRIGNTPQASIHAGYERAFGTIIDSNITTLIAGFALFMFGSGSVRGFAVVLCLGILTSMFSGVMVSRALVNLLYGGRRLDRLAIG